MDARCQMVVTCMHVAAMFAHWANCRMQCVCCWRPVAFRTGLSLPLAWTTGWRWSLCVFLSQSVSPFWCLSLSPAGAMLWTCWMPPCLPSLPRREVRCGKRATLFLSIRFLIWCAVTRHPPAGHEARAIPLRMPDRHARSRLGLPDAIPPWPWEGRRVRVCLQASRRWDIGVIGQLRPELDFDAWSPAGMRVIEIVQKSCCEKEESESNVTAAGSRNPAVHRQTQVQA
ncbi:hypothetical protein QBC39DRAFT_77816 [Podospora conica]|nr:hypothetical protein QBC39DRAFT_77816 [Schizothecium conicum]